MHKESGILKVVSILDIKPEDKFIPGNSGIVEDYDPWEVISVSAKTKDVKVKAFQPGRELYRVEFKYLRTDSVVKVV